MTETLGSNRNKRRTKFFLFVCTKCKVKRQRIDCENPCPCGGRLARAKSEFDKRVERQALKIQKELRGEM